MTDKLSLYESLDALYRSLPTLDCKRRCHGSCGPILCGAAEWQRVRERLGSVPPLQGLDCPGGPASELVRITAAAPR